MRIAFVALSVGVVACGGQEVAPSSSREPSDGLFGGSGQEPTTAEIERFAEVDLPRDTEGLQAWTNSGIDTTLSFRLAMSREDFDRFYERSDFTEELVKGERPSIWQQGPIDWDMDAIEVPWGHEELVNAFSRTVLVDFADPDRPIVYMTASTT